MTQEEVYRLSFLRTQLLVFFSFSLARIIAGQQVKQKFAKAQKKFGRAASVLRIQKVVNNLVGKHELFKQYMYINTLYMWKYIYYSFSIKLSFSDI